MAAIDIDIGRPRRPRSLRLATALWAAALLALACLPWTSGQVILYQPPATVTTIVYANSSATADAAGTGTSVKLSALTDVAYCPLDTSLYATSGASGNLKRIAVSYPYLSSTVTFLGGSPTGIDIDQTTCLMYVASWSTGTIRKLTYPAFNAPVTIATIASAYDVGVDRPRSQLYVTALSGLYRMDTAGGGLTLLHNETSMDSAGLAVDPSRDRLYIAAQSQARILYLDMSAQAGYLGGVLRTLCGPLTASVGAADGACLSSVRFTYPSWVAYSPARDTLFLTDSGTETVRAINLLWGTASTVAGCGATALSNDGVGTAACLDNLSGGVYVQSSGALFVVMSTVTGLVRRIDVGGVGGAEVQLTGGGHIEIVGGGGIIVGG